MKIEILYVPGCPNHGPAAERLKQALESEGVSAQIEQVLVRDHGMAESLKFPGSPTIRIDGRDVEPEGSLGRAGLACRLYHDPEAGGAGVPPLDMIRRAVRAQRAGSEQRATKEGAENAEPRERNAREA